jgi:hypothetical protein
MLPEQIPTSKPVQPMGWPIYSFQNQANQARQEAEGQRRRADQLARRCRRLRSVAAVALTCTVVGMAAAFALGSIVGYAFGAGLLGLVGR